jgi:hypothetical protein
MGVKAGLGIMVKTLGVSPVKTRLAGALGVDAAERVYSECLRCVEEVAELAAGAVVAYWAVAEAAGDASWSGFPRLTQGEGGLGERMARIHDALLERHGAGLLIGADTPQIEPLDLRQAAAWLLGAGPRLVIGPSRDGGFWLFGANRRVAIERWTSVAYSTGATRAQFRAALDGLGEWLELRELVDLDTAADVADVADALECVARPTEGQRRLRRALARLDVEAAS